MTHTFDLGAEGAQLGREGFYQTAETCLAMAYPTPENLYNRANALRRLGRYREAWDVAERAESIGNNDDIQHLLGCLALDANAPGLARKYLDPIKHKHHTWRFSYALACLHGGYWEEGFHHYDARLEHHTQPLPMWDGRPLENQVLALTCEQGLGDSIMFSRFRDMIPGRYILLTPNVLTRILHGQTGNKPFEAYWQLPLMSLPNRLGLKELPPLKPYIAPLERFDLPRLADTRLNVGIVWRSKSGGFLRKRHEVEHGEQKSIPLKLLLPLATVPGVKLYSLQHDGDKDIGSIGAGPLIQNLGPQILDFADLAAFMQEMDVIVSADTGPAHLAGAMGKPTIVMLNYAGSWQWGCGEKTPWYSSVELLRQTTPGDWKPVVEAVCKRLA